MSITGVKILTGACWTWTIEEAAWLKINEQGICVWGEVGFAWILIGNGPGPEYQPAVRTMAAHSVSWGDTQRFGHCQKAWSWELGEYSMNKDLHLLWYQLITVMERLNQ